MSEVNLERECDELKVLVVELRAEKEKLRLVIADCTDFHCRTEPK